MAEESIDTVLNALPQKNVTVYALRALDFVVPGEWENITNFDEMIRSATGEEDASKRYSLAIKAKELYADESTGLQRALWLYQMTDKADAALGTAAMASKIGGSINFLSFLNRLTPSADTTQSIDLALKVVVEILAFSFMNGVPRSREGIAQFTTALRDHYSHESIMRMAALVCLDGIIPLGPDFVEKVGDILGSAGSGELTKNPLFSTIGKLIPGDSPEGKFGFITDSYNSVKGWMDELLQSRGLTTEKVTSSLKQYVQFTDDKLDYLAAFFDMSTNYYTHTGIQSIARTAILAAQGQITPPSLSAAELGEMPSAASLGAPPPPPGASDSSTGEALYDYFASSPGYLSFSQGERLTVHGGEQGGWYHASNQSGQSGWSPASYIKLGVPAAAAPATPAAAPGPKSAVLTADNYGSTFLVRAGEPISIAGGEQNGWYWATNSSGQSGWVVASIVRLQ